MNSIAFDWQARRFVETHVNFFVLELLKVPRLEDAAFDALATCSARLSCVDNRFAEFAEACRVEYGPLAEDERTQMRAEIDAIVASAWELDKDDLQVIFEDFTETAVPLEYRQLVLTSLDSLSSASKA